jgi:hypothetical protein
MGNYAKYIGNGQCISCKHFHLSGWNFHFGSGYDGTCDADKHDCDSYVNCTIGRYKPKTVEELNSIKY